MNIIEAMVGPRGSRGRTGRIALLVLLCVLQYVIGGLRWEQFVLYDGAEYLKMAENLLSTGEYSYDGINPIVGKPPGFPLLLATFVAVFGSIEHFHYLQNLFFLLAFILVAASASRLVGMNWALGILAFFVSLEPLRWLAFGVMSEPPFILLTAIGMYAILRHRECHTYRWAVLAGIAFGLSAYIRPVNFLWPMALIILYWLTNRRHWRAALLVLAVHVILVGPWVARNAVLFKRFVPMVSNWGLLYYMTDPELYDLLHHGGVSDVMKTETFQRFVGGDCQFNWGPSERFQTTALDRIQADPVGYLGRCLHQSFFVWTYIPGTRELMLTGSIWFYLGRVAMALFYMLVLMGALKVWKRHPMLVIATIGYALYTAAVLFPVRTESRYLVTPYMWLLPLTAAGAKATLLRVVALMKPKNGRDANQIPSRIE